MRIYRHICCLLPLLAGVVTGCGAQADSGEVASSSTPTELTTSTVAPPITEQPLEELPDLRNYTRDQALNVLLGLGLVPEFQPLPSEAAPDTVLSTTPRGGTPIKPGSAVIVKYAVPPVHDLTVVYEVRDRFWRDLGAGACDFPTQDVRVGTSFRLIGPDSVNLSAASIDQSGRVSPSVDPAHTGQVCRWDFIFRAVPEVATYALVAPDGVVYPAASLNNLKDYQWNWRWWHART